MNRLTPAQYPVISHIVRDETEFPSITLAYQRQEGEFWVDRIAAPSVVIGVLPKDTFVWGDLSVPGVKPLLACPPLSTATTVSAISHPLCRRASE